MTDTPMATSLHQRPLLHMLAENWWLILIRGICAILFGILTFIWPAITLVLLVVLFGVYALADGVFAILAAIRGNVPSRWWLLLVGILGIIAGLIALILPGMTALVLLIVIASWAIATGIMQIVGAIALRKEIENEWLLIGSGALSVLFGIVLLAQPGTGALALVLVIGVYALLYGIMLTVFAMRLRQHRHVAA